MGETDRQFRVRLPSGRDLGVMPVSAVVLMIRKGVIGPDTLLQRVGSQKWRPAEQVATAVFDAVRGEAARKRAERRRAQEEAEASNPSRVVPSSGPPPLPGALSPTSAPPSGDGATGTDPPDPVDFLDDPSMLDVDLTDPYAPGIEAADVPTFNPLAASMEVAVPPAIPPQLPAWAHAQNAVAAPVRGESESERAVPAGFVILAWVTALALLADIPLSFLLEVASATTNPKMNAELAAKLGPKMWAVQMQGLPAPLLALIPGAIVVGWVTSRLPWHAQPHPASVSVIRWLLPTLAPLVTVLVIAAFPRDWVRASFLLGAATLLVTQWGAALPWTLTGAINERIQQRKWRIWGWAGPVAGGFMGASCLAMAGANAYLSFATRGLVGEDEFQQRMVAGFVGLLLVVGLGTRILGLIFTAIWIVQLATKLSKVPLAALEWRD